MKRSFIPGLYDSGAAYEPGDYRNNWEIWRRGRSYRHRWKMPHIVYELCYRSPPHLARAGRPQWVRF